MKNKSDERGYLRSYRGVIAAYVCMIIVGAHDIFDAAMSGKASSSLWFFIMVWALGSLALLLTVKKEIARRRAAWREMNQTQMNRPGYFDVAGRSND
ncbi:hypothetical protein KDH_24530 [Dictyobacter sp. S3.2.2.5]|uniref:Uncharacterized protein n=1 Tax=Dictyobacter halimunensis TaxID=3026934 RepID=A0ABQ6FN01_9CHLR|nr:hypothetical protein KDH_24530 [Dictyobacter sp. S3.2.2.5]